ncbi:MAG: anti-sigma factor [Mycobacteriales bacterium]
MSRADAHVRFEELAAGHALHALEPEDEQVFRSHLEGCTRCERDLMEHAATLAHLAYAPDAAEPPPALLEGIRAGIRSSGREVGSSEPAEPVVSLETARRRRDATRMRRAAVWTSMAAAAALVLGLGGWVTALLQDRDEQAQLSGRLAAALSQLREASTVPLQGESGEVVAVALVRGNEISLVVDGLPVNDAATTYVLWGESRYGDKRAVGVFDVTTDDLDVLSGMRLQAGVSDVVRLMVTREQGDVAPPIPTLPVLASGTV